MKRDTKPMSRLELLPTELMSQILAEVGKTSREDVRNTILTCKRLEIAADDPRVFKNMELNHIVASPLLAVDNYQDLMMKCLEHDNPSAHFVQGFLEYFHYNHPAQGLAHLSTAAHAQDAKPEALYLYGMINLCVGNFELGRQYMNRLRSGNDNSKGDECWKNIKRALHGIGNMPKPEYFESLMAMMPPFECNVNDMDTTCPRCYHYKQMVKFVYTI